MSASSPVGRVFKIETMGAVDGPGLRLVLFLQGCPLRCPYCHNPEGWPLSGGREIAIDEVMATLRRYRAYYEGGGLTLSGGEPLTQAAFVRELFERCRAEGVHTALDTSACMMYDESIAAMDAADLLLLDVKSPDPKVCARVFGFPLENVVNILRRAEERGQKVWARHVIAPKISDSTENVEKLEKLLRPFSCVEKVELLPFRKLCAEKYEALGIPFPMGAEEEVSDAVGGIMVKKKERGL